VLSVVAIAALVSDVGLTGLALRDSARAQGDRRAELLSGLMGVRVIVAVLGVVAAVGFAALAGYDADVVLGAAIASAGLFPQIYADMVVVTLVVDGRFAGATSVETARSVGSSVLIIALVIAGAGLPWFLAAWAGAALIAAATARRFGRGAVSFTWPSRSSAKAALAGSAGYTLATALHVIYFRSVMLVVATRGAAAAAGEYAAAFRITEFVGAAAGQAAGSTTPTLARDVSAAKRVLAAAGGFGVLIGAALALLAPLAMKVLGGEALESAADTLRLQAIAAGLMFPSFAAGAVLFTRHRYRALITANATALGVALIAALLLVPDHGANGAAVAACLGELALVAAQGAALTRSQST
jgi:O-antigen/teichoic acid export membrane protein